MVRVINDSIPDRMVIVRVRVTNDGARGRMAVIRVRVTNGGEWGIVWARVRVKRGLKEEEEGGNVRSYGS
jgi:hypothetical protein